MAVRIFRFTRGLRFRIAVSYVVFFGVLLVLIGLFFRQTLQTTFEQQEEQALEEEWGAVKGYLRLGPQGWDFFYDRHDPEESFIVNRIRRVYIFTDSAGHVLQSSPIYDSIGREQPAFIEGVVSHNDRGFLTRRAPDGTVYMIRYGVLWDEHRHRYFLAVGRPISDNTHVIREFAIKYFSWLPLVLSASALLGWYMAGRALAPVNRVAEAAQRITHSNLDTKIPLRNARDELDRLIEAFNSMMERLRLSFEQIQQFSTDVSHELRTPLTVIRGQLEVAMFTSNSVEQYREAMINALEEVERLSNIVRALLLLSQAESGRLVLQRTPVDLAAVVRDLVDQYKIYAESANVRLSAEASGSAVIDGDRIQIERMITNLLSNAIKYTLPGGQVHVTVEPHDDMARLIVADTGVGIPADHLPHIFERFYRVPSADPEKGIGLGLSFVAWIVRVHGGTIAVDSTPGQGSRFTIDLPCTPGAQPLLAEAAELNPISNAS